MSHTFVSLVLLGLALPWVVPDAYALGRSRNVEIRSKSHVARFKLDEAFSPEQQKIIINDLRFIAEIASDSPGTPIHGKIFGGGVHGDIYLPWFSKRVGQIRYAKKGTQWESENLVAYSIPRGDFSAGLMDAIFLTDKYFSGDVYSFARPDLSRAATLIHEARHKDRNMDHIPCVRRSTEMYDRLGEIDPLMEESIPSCDVHALSASATEVEFSVNVARTGTDYVASHALFPFASLARRIIDLSARRELNEDLYGPMVPNSFVDEVVFGDDQRVRESLRKGVPSAVLDEALEKAMSRGNYGMLEILVDAGADIEKIRPRLRFSTLTLERLSRAFIEKLVLKHRFPLSTGSPFPILSLVPCNLSMVEFLLRLGAEPCGTEAPEWARPQKFVPQCTDISVADRERLGQLLACPEAKK